MPVSKLRFGHRLRAKNPKETVNPYTVAGSLLYGKLIAAVTGIRYDMTVEIALEREHRRGISKRRRNTGGHWLPAGPGSREAQRRTRQTLTQHPSVLRRFPSADRADVAAAIAQAEGLDPYRLIAGEDKRTRDARIKRERRALTAA